MKIKVTKDTISPKLAKLKTKLQMRNLGRSIGNIALADILRNFKTKGRNIGKRWEPLSSATFILGRKGSVPLRNTGAMMNAIHNKILDKSIEVRSNTVKGGVDIAAVHHYGVKPYTPSAKQRAWFHYHGIHLKKNTKVGIPQRMFMLVSVNAQSEIMNLPKVIVKDI